MFSSKNVLHIFLITVAFAHKKISALHRAPNINISILTPYIT